MYQFEVDINIRGRVKVNAVSKDDAKQLIFSINKNDLNKLLEKDDLYPLIEVNNIEYSYDSFEGCPKCHTPLYYMDAIRNEIAIVLKGGEVSKDDVESIDVNIRNHAKVKCGSKECGFQADYRYLLG
jgi:hypothetical protein